MWIVKQSRAAIYCYIFIGFFFSQKAFSQNSLLGKWVDIAHKEKKIEMYLGGDKKVYGKSENGLLVFKSLVFTSETNTYRGLLINPDNQEEFSIIIKQPTPDSFIFSVGKFIFSRKFSFVRQL